MAYDNNNIFAKILRGEAPSFKVYEDERTFAFMDVMPQSEGHTLVIPKVQAENIFDLPPDDAANLIQVTQKIAVAVKRAIKAPGIMLAQLNGSEAGQTVFHIHMHVIPRWSGADLKLHARELADFEVLKAQAELIKAELERL
jgi:histidine triad (HIT) family protein